MASGRNIKPQGEALREAVRWLAYEGCYDLATIEEACRQFDLSPADEEFMLRHFLHADEQVIPNPAMPPQPESEA